MSEAHIQYEDEGPARRQPIQREWALHRGVRRFVRRCVDVPYEFVSYDRGRARSDIEHIKEAERGLRHDWPDTNLLWGDGRDFHCELKAAGKKPKKQGGQMGILDKLQSMGHPAAWANSVKMYAQEALKAGVPLRASWPAVAEHEDALVAADIRAQESRAAAKRAGTWKAGKLRAPKPTAGQVKAYRRVGVVV